MFKLLSIILIFSYLFPSEDYFSKWDKSIKNNINFWEEESKLIDWYQPYDQVWKEKKHPLHGAWFVNGKLNVAYNCVTRWAKKFPDKIALIWIGEEDTFDYPIQKIYTYSSLEKEISKAANMLKSFNIKKGDKVCIWLPMIPQLLISQLACAKIGAIHNVIFAGFGIKSLEERIKDSSSKILITADQNVRKGKKIEMKNLIDPILKNCASIEKVIVVKRTGSPINLDEKRDCYWNEKISLFSSICENVSMDSNDPLFILYSSGTTGKPKGIIHSSGGYLVYVLSTLKHGWKVKGLLNSQKERDVWYCTADIGWITGHSYLTYGPLAFGLITIMYEGTPFYPDHDRYWEIIERFKVTHFYTSPTAIRALASLDEKYIKKHDLSSLKLLGTVGEPINPTSWKWYFKKIGKGKIPILDTYWQTETGGNIILPLIDKKKLKPGSCSNPFYGISLKILNKEGKEIISPYQKGFLCINKPWPGMMKTIYKDEKLFFSNYLNKFKNLYFTGDYAYKDEDGFYWILGRSDDIIKISGHRLGTAELENIICSHKKIKEVAITTIPDDIKGNDIIAFIVLKQSEKDLQKLKEEIISYIIKSFGPIAKPQHIIFCSDLPKTYSGKIVRRLLKKIFLKEEIGDISTLKNKNCIEKIINEVKNQMEQLIF